MSALLKALAEPRRQQIIGLVLDRELAAGSIHQAMNDVTKGAVSQHLRVLTEAGALRMRREGRHRFYRADEATLAPFREHLETVWGRGLARLKRLAEADDRRRLAKRRRTRP